MMHRCDLAQMHQIPWTKPMGQATTIRTAVGVAFTSPKMQIPARKPVAMPSASALSDQLAKVLSDRWGHGGNFLQLADAMVDALCAHIAKASTEKMDKRLVDAIEDHMSVDPKEGDVDADLEVSIEDIEAERGRAYARFSVDAAQITAERFQTFTPAEASAMVGAMLKRPSESERYKALREMGSTPATALSIILNERRQAVAIANWNGGAL